MKFEVECVFGQEGPPFIIARQTEVGHFSVSTSSRLGGVPIQPSLSQPRKLKPDGSPDLDVFAFALTDPQDAERFSVGQIIELVP